MSGGSPGTGSGGATGGGSGIPDPEDPLAFSYLKKVIYRDKAIYNPTKEFIFASVIETTHIENPLGRYYLYYAPHDPPGGISLAYADDIEGPYTEYPENPLLSNTYEGRFSVSHVSSPHVLWMEEYDKYFLYFHGENTTTRWAHSVDGIDWEVAEDNVSLNTTQWGTSFSGRKFSECSYARVFKYTIPEYGDPYTMVMMLIESGYGRRIGLATSSDGKHFTPRKPALISPTTDEGTDLSGAFYLPHGGRHFVVYHGASGNIHYTDVGENFDKEEHQGIFYDPKPEFPEYDKASAPYFIEVGGRMYFFYDVGARLDQSIALAVQTPWPSDNVLVDNDSSEFSTNGVWTSSTSVDGYAGADYLTDESEAANAGAWAEWRPTFKRSGYYKVYARWTAHENRPDHIKYEITHQGNVTEVFADQTDQNGSWMELGRYYFDEGNSEANRLVLDAGSDTGISVADAAWFVFDP